MASKIRPLQDRVIVKRTDEAEQMRGGLYIPDTAKEKPQEGEIIAVGPGARFDPTVSPERGTDMNRLYQYRIDVVGYKADQVDVIEVKPNAGASAVGQILNYRKLYIEDFAPQIAPKAIIVTDFVKPEIAQYAAEQGVQIVAVG